MAERRAPAAGFSLIELLVVVAIIGLALTVMLSGQSTLLPKTRLRGAAYELGSSIESARSAAVLRNQPVVLAYDVTAGSYEAFEPHDLDDLGRITGPGRFPLIDPVRLPGGVAFKLVRLPGSLPRDAGVVELEVTALGRVTPHELVLYNPDFPDTEVLTVRVNGIANRTEVLPGDTVMAVLDDVDFR